MTTVLLAALVVFAAPAECKADLDCFLLALKTCAPAKYVDSNLDGSGAGKRAGVIPIGATEYLVGPGKDEVCALTIQTRVDEVELSVVLVSRLGRQAASKRSIALQLARDQGVLQRCAMTGEQIKKALEQRRQGDFDRAAWSSCQPAGCAAVLPADNGCAWSECQQTTRVLSCGESQKEIRCAAWSSTGPQKTGPQSVLLRDRLEDERPCVARCPRPDGEPEVVCR